MKPAMKKVLLYATLCVMIIALCAAIGSLIVIWNDDQPVSQDADMVSQLRLKGTFSSDLSSELMVIPEDGGLGLSGERRVVMNGHFNRAIPQGQLLILRLDNMEVNVYINGVLLEEHGRAEKLPTYALSPGNRWGYFPSPGITPEDDVRIELHNLYANHTEMAYRLLLTEMYGGYAYPLMMRNLSGWLPNTLISLLLVCISLVAFLYGTMLWKGQYCYGDVLSFAAFCLFAGIWFFVDFTTLSYFVDRQVFNNALDILSLVMMAGMLMISFGYQFKSKCRYLCRGMGILFMLLVCGLSVGQFAFRKDYYLGYLVLEIMVIISTVILLVTLWREWHITKDSREDRWMLICDWLICAGIIGDFILYVFQLSPSVRIFKIFFCLFAVCRIAHIMLAVRSMSYERTQIKVLESQHAQLEKACKYQQLISEATRGLYERILEVDLTHDCLVGENGAKQLKSWGLEPNTTFSQTLRTIAMSSIHPMDRKFYLETLNPTKALNTFAGGQDALVCEFRAFDRQEDCYHWAQINGRMFYWSDDESVRMILFRKNIDDAKQREAELHEMALHDGLTGLYNKPAFENQARALLRDADKTAYLALFVVDIDHFKEVNDVHGHLVGDEALRRFAAALKGQFRSMDIIGRIGGDEFAVLIRYADADWIDVKAQRLRDALRIDEIFDDHDLHLTASVGVAVALPDEPVYDDLFKRADEVLYQVKQDGRDGYRISRYGKREPEEP